MLLFFIASRFRSCLFLRHITMRTPQIICVGKMGRLTLSASPPPPHCPLMLSHNTALPHTKYYRSFKCSSQKQGTCSRSSFISFIYWWFTSVLIQSRLLLLCTLSALCARCMNGRAVSMSVHIFHRQNPVTELSKIWYRMVCSERRHLNFTLVCRCSSAKFSHVSHPRFTCFASRWQTNQDWLEIDAI
jgi:hypothetical protein